MVRKQKQRNIGFYPEVIYFKPRGVPTYCLQEVCLTIDELEAIRLVDFEGKEQRQAAEEMGVSQSTLQRILAKARKKVAEGLVVGKAITAKGGEIKMIGFNRGRGGGFGGGRGRLKGQFAAGPGGVCVCTNPDCAHEAAHLAGVPCYQQKCPKCGSPMIRKI